MNYEPIKMESLSRFYGDLLGFYGVLVVINGEHGDFVKI